MELFRKHQMCILFLCLVLAQACTVQGGRNRPITGTLNRSNSGLDRLPDLLNLNNTLTFLISGNNLECFPCRSGGFTASRLTTLDLSHNQIREFNLSTSSMPLLMMLNLSHNRLSTIASGSFSNLTNLQVLDVSFNRLTDLSGGMWEGPVELRELHLVGNELSRIKSGDFVSLRQLKDLHLSHNNIAVIEMNAFTDLTRLVNLQLYRNQLNEIPHLPEVFREYLQSLNLSGNRIQMVGPDAFGELRYLHRLDLSKMNLISVDATAFQGLSALNELYLNTNNLQTLSLQTIDRLRGLHTLSLYKNRWDCDCDLSRISEYLSKNKDKIYVTQFDSTKCRTSDSSMRTLQQLDSMEFCDFYKVLIPAVVGSVGFLAISAFFLFCICRKRNSNRPIEQTSSDLTELTSSASVIRMTYFERPITDNTGNNNDFTHGNNSTLVSTTSEHLSSSDKNSAHTYSNLEGRTKVALNHPIRARASRFAMFRNWHPKPPEPEQNQTRKAPKLPTRNPELTDDNEYAVHVPNE